MLITHRRIYVEEGTQCSYTVIMRTIAIMEQLQVVCATEVTHIRLM